MAAITLLYGMTGCSIAARPCSELFVRETMRRCRPESPVEMHRLARTAAHHVPDGPVICCWRRLRVMAD